MRYQQKSPSQVTPMTPIQATHPLQFVTMDYSTVEKAMVYENILVIIDHLPNLPRHTQQRIKGNHKSQVCGSTLFDHMVSQRNFIQIKDKHLWVN